MRRHQDVCGFQVQDVLRAAVSQDVGRGLVGEHRPSVLDDDDPLDRSLDEIPVSCLALAQGLFRLDTLAPVVNVDQILELAGAFVDKTVDDFLECPGQRKDPPPAIGLVCARRDHAHGHQFVEAAVHRRLGQSRLDVQVRDQSRAAGQVILKDNEKDIPKRPLQRQRTLLLGPGHEIGFDDHAKSLVTQEIVFENYRDRRMSLGDRLP